MTCTACGSVTRRSAVARKGYWTVRCLSCGLGGIDPVPDAQTLADYYSQRYVLAVSSELVDRKRILAQADRLTRDLRRYAPEARTLCEIGCSAGWLLHEMRSRGYAVKGYELSAATSRWARERFGLDVVTGELTGDGDCFDVIVMRHVLEHTRDTLAQLATASGRLAPGGTLIVAVPNGASLASRVLGQYWSWYIPPAHIWYFTRPSLTRLIERVQLQPVSVTTQQGDAANPCYELALGLGRRVIAAIRPTAAGSTDNQRLAGLGSDRTIGRRRLWLRVYQVTAVALAPIGSLVAHLGLADEIWAVARKPLDPGRTESI